VRPPFPIGVAFLDSSATRISLSDESTPRM
jgi:hypothetical protein